MASSITSNPYRDDARRRQTYDSTPAWLSTQYENRPSQSVTNGPREVMTANGPQTRSQRQIRRAYNKAMKAAGMKTVKWGDG